MTEQDYRYEMRFWLEASKDAKMRGDEVNEKHAILKFREYRDELLDLWRAKAKRFSQCS